MDMKQLTHEVETELLKIMIRHLKSGKLKLPMAKTIAKEFLAFLPFENDETMNTKLKSFTDKYPDFKSIYISTLEEEEDKSVSELLTKMRGYMKENKIDEALKVVK